MEIIGGQLTQTNGNPAFPGATSTGPLIAGNIVNNDGSGTLGGVGAVTGVANQGYVEMVQFSAPLTQAAASAAGGVTTQIAIPAQSMIAQMLVYVTTAWTSSTTITVADTASNTYGTAAGASIGVIGLTPTATKAVVQLWENVGNTDVNLTVTAAGTGSGVCMLWVRYVQSCNSAKSA